MFDKNPKLNTVSADSRLIKPSAAELNVSYGNGTHPLAVAQLQPGAQDRYFTRKYTVDDQTKILVLFDGTSGANVISSTFIRNWTGLSFPNEIKYPQGGYLNAELKAKNGIIVNQLRLQTPDVSVFGQLKVKYMKLDGSEHVQALDIARNINEYQFKDNILHIPIRALLSAGADVCAMIVEVQPAASGETYNVSATLDIEKVLGYVSHI